MPRDDPFADRPITNGILAGFRLAGLAEELKTARLERAEFEATRAHRDQMRMIQEELGLSQIKNEALQAEYLKIQQTSAQEGLEESRALRPGKIKAQGLELQQLELGVTDMVEQLAENRAIRPEKIKSAKLGNKKTEAEIAGQRQLTKESKSRTGNNIMEGVLLQQQAQAGVGRSAGLTAGELTHDEALALAADAMTAAGVKFNPGDANHNIWALGIRGQSAAMAEELKVLREGNVLEKAGKNVELAENMASAAMRTADPEGAIEVIAESFKDNPDAVAAARQLVAGGLESQRSADQQEFTAGTETKALGGIFEERAAIVNEIARLDAQLETGKKLDRSSKSRYDELKIRKRKLDEEIESLRETFGGKKVRKKPAAGSEIPTIKNQADYDKLAPGTTFIDAADGKRYKKP